ncbi:hypothetical protein Syun_031582 [Stephania yunnanensis]|uniref:Uncharacterized protein n=1 Tax=Stephania yunnanensis TaxID=152371 RepID=A0AAP0DW54_9MAGN
MDLLSTCWFIIEYVLIPDGFMKWICLSFFIYPFLLFFCQIEIDLFENFNQIYVM